LGKEERGKKRRANVDLKMVFQDSLGKSSRGKGQTNDGGRMNLALRTRFRARPGKSSQGRKKAPGG